MKWPRPLLRPPSSSWCTWSQPRHIRVSLIPLGLEHDLTPELAAVVVPPGPELVLPPIDLPGLQLEPTCLIGLGGDEQVLEVLVRGVVDLLFVGAHEANPGLDAGGDFGVLELEEQAVLAREGVSGLGDLVARPADLDDVLAHLHAHRHPQQSSILGFFLLSGRASREVGLVLPSLGVCEVGAVVLVDRQAEPALEGADVVLEEVRVFVQVDGFQRKFAQSFSSVCVGCALGSDAATAEFRAGPILIVHAEISKNRWCVVGRLLKGVNADRG